MLRTVITGSGSYIPPFVHSNAAFVHHTFYTEKHEPIDLVSADVIRKFKDITGIDERRYTTDNLNASDIGAMAALTAIEHSKVNPEEIGQLIVAHNFGDVIKDTIQTDSVPSLASRIKHAIGIRNPYCIAYDILFGCPGWLQGVIQADAFFKAGLAKKALVVGTETLSRVIDKSDRDSMIFSDGAGAAVLEYRETGDTGPGIIGTAALSHTVNEVNLINMGRSYHPDAESRVRYIKMKGRKVYEYAMKFVPAAMKECLDNCNVDISQLKKIFIHQANEKMDEGIIERFYQLYGKTVNAAEVMPMSIHWLGNSSVATIPTLYDLVLKNKVEGHSLKPGDIILFASVGAGMNVNAVCYRC